MCFAVVLRHWIGLLLLLLLLLTFQLCLQCDGGLRQQIFIFIKRLRHADRSSENTLGKIFLTFLSSLN